MFGSNLSQRNLYWLGYRFMTFKTDHPILEWNKNKNKSHFLFYLQWSVITWLLFWKSAEHIYSWISNLGFHLQSRQCACTIRCHHRYLQTASRTPQGVSLVATLYLFALCKPSGSAATSVPCCAPHRHS